jgi:hypothetical protein
MSLGNWGQSFLKEVGEGLFGNDYLRDYTHASKTFRTNSYAYAPKFKFLFHVYFDINTEIPLNLPKDANFGLAVKTVKLPNFQLVTQELNQYNRKRIVQTKVKYDPIDITFHDDNDNLITRLWTTYFTYYYKDSSKPQVVFNGRRGNLATPTNISGGNQVSPGAANYNLRTQYLPSDWYSGNSDWGYNGDSNNSSGVKIPFFKQIHIFGFNQHNFTAYTLINPVITRFGHDTYSYSDGGGTMENSMSIDYETVVYNSGAIDGREPGQIVAGFGSESNYDRRVSPIAQPGANGTILGQGGLVDGVGGTISALAKGDILGAARNAGVTYNTFKNTNIKATARAEVTTNLINGLQQTPNRNNLFNTPIFGATPSNVGTAGSPATGSSSPSNVSPTRNAGKVVTPPTGR